LFGSRWPMISAATGIIAAGCLCIMIYFCNMKRDRDPIVPAASEVLHEAAPSSTTTTPDEAIAEDTLCETRDAPKALRKPNIPEMQRRSTTTQQIQVTPRLVPVEPVPDDISTPTPPGRARRLPAFHGGISTGQCHRAES
jgi:hypothetical protein